MKLVGPSKLAGQVFKKCDFVFRSATRMEHVRRATTDHWQSGHLLKSWGTLYDPGRDWHWRSEHRRFLRPTAPLDSVLTVVPNSRRGANNQHH